MGEFDSQQLMPPWKDRAWAGVTPEAEAAEAAAESTAAAAVVAKPTAAVATAVAATAAAGAGVVTEEARKTAVDYRKTP